MSGTLVEAKVTGYCTTARGLMGDTKDWHVGAIPLINMAIVKAKSQYGDKQPVIPSYEVNLYQKPF